MKEKIEQATIRSEVSHRGGGIEIDLSDFGYPGEKMTAYQNYLGGGILGRVASDCTINDWTDDDKLEEISEELKKYYFSLTNPPAEIDGEKVWEHMTYEQNQRMRVSGF